MISVLQPLDGGSSPAAGPGSKMAAKNRKLLGRFTREFQANASRSGAAASAGYGLIGAICLLGGLGFLADRWLNTSPWLLVTGLFLGIIVGFYELAKTIWR